MTQLDSKGYVVEETWRHAYKKLKLGYEKSLEQKDEIQTGYRADCKKLRPYLNNI